MSKDKTPPPPPPPPPKPTMLPGGVDKLIQVIEDMRGRNTDGYLTEVGGLLANIKQPPPLPIPPKCCATTCSPFSATVVALAFDPQYPRDDLGGDPYVPMYDEGKVEMMPYSDFYHLHNTINQPIESIVKYALGDEITDLTTLRRGDLLAIGWVNGVGHAVYVWDVHLDDDKKVDCVQIIGSNGPVPGVSIYGCTGPDFLTGKNATKATATKEVEVPVVDKVTKVTTKEKKTVTYTTGIGTRGTLQKVGGKDAKIFVDSDKVVQQGVWYGIPKAKKPRPETFKVPPQQYYAAGTGPYTIDTLRAARFHYQGPPTEPQSMKDPPPPPAPPAPPGHVDTPAKVVKGKDIKKDPGAPQKVPTVPAKQEKERPLDWQHYVETALQILFRTKWIESDPGKSENINDAASQKALKEYQDKLKLDVDGIIGPQTLASLSRQLPACTSQASSQVLLGALFRGKKIQADPGPVDGVNNPKTRDAVEEFQKANGLTPTKVPDADTQAMLAKVVQGHAATTEKPGLEPQVQHLYWVGNRVDAGGTCTLRMHYKDLKLGQECPIELEDLISKARVSIATTIKTGAGETEVQVTMPADFKNGARVVAHVTAAIDGDDDGTLNGTTTAPLAIGGGMEPVSWRPYIDKDEVPADVLDAIKRNRAQYPMKTFPLATGIWAGIDHYDYKPNTAHQAWATGWANAKIDAAKQTNDRATLHVATSFLLMFDKEGLPASFQTYDGEVITWGVGLGGTGDGKHAFTVLDRDPKMKALLEAVGMNYDARDYSFRVVDLNQKKVISSTFAVGDERGKDERHKPPLEACRQQKDLMSALIGMSEDPATRDAVLDSQWQVYLANSTKWSGQDKVYSLALFFMITHMYQWLPAIGDMGIHVGKAFAAAGGGDPSTDMDTKMAPRIALSFIAAAKQYQAMLAKKGKPFDYDDVRTRTKTKLWAAFKDDAKKEGFSPGELTYED